ncbi:MAG TPA: ribosome-associated translation inhibitor RaiA [Mycobacteriales bacterium]|nr:ribosome-associated translation inhibitor RaiA [Mycobacteriales bacterium]
MEILVRGRNVEVPEHFRQHVEDKLHRIERYDHKIIRVDVELYHERNPRQAGSCQRVEITCKSRGPVIRAEACAADFYTALDTCVARIDGRLRRSADRRRVHRGMRTPTSVAAATGSVEPAYAERGGEGGVATLLEEPPESDDGPGRIVREKEHPAKPMTIDQALFEMELVGHDFFLFADADSGQPSVVYRRKGYDYGVIRLVS